MFGQFDPEAFDKKQNVSSENYEDLLPDHKEQVRELLGSYVGTKKVLTGGEYAKLIQVIHAANLSAKDLETFMKEEGISIEPAFSDSELTNTISFDTPDNGLYRPH